MPDSYIILHVVCYATFLNMYNSHLNIENYLSNQRNSTLFHRLAIDMKNFLLAKTFYPAS